ncbi:MAG: hypothetical protein QW471_01155 [Candidatus Woesearchaeota archaeon]
MEFKTHSNPLKHLREEHLIFFLFLVSTSIFVFQHAAYFSWDFHSYVLNAKYWFANGNYFEPLRPPLMPFLVGVFSIFGWRASEFVFIIFVSFLFMYSSVRLARALGFNALAFYALSLNAYVFSVGLVNGTELLAFVFLELFVSFLIEDNPLSGLWLGLSALSRYVALALFPLAFLHLNFKKAFRSLLLFFLILSPWLIYNYFRFGNFFTSIADLYANNVLYRSYLVQPIRFSHFVNLFNVLFPFFLVGVFVVSRRLFLKLRFIGRDLRLLKFWRVLRTFKAELLMFFLLFFSVWSYAFTPAKDLRYLFNLALPNFYFSYVGLSSIVAWMNFKKRSLVLASLLVFVLSLCMFLVNFLVYSYSDGRVYYSVVDKLRELNMSNCSVMSNNWVQLDYLGIAAEPAPMQALAYKRLEEGKVLILFYHTHGIVEEPAYVQNESFMNSLPIIYKNDSYIIAGFGSCISGKIFDYSYVDQIDRNIFEAYGYHINTNPCFLLFGKISILERFCNFVNFKGFKHDEYRIYE